MAQLKDMPGYRVKKKKRWDKSVDAYKGEHLLTPGVQFAPGSDWKKGTRGYTATANLRRGHSVWSKKGGLGKRLMGSRAADTHEGTGGYIWDPETGTYVEAAATETGGGRGGSARYAARTVHNWWKDAVKDPYLDWMAKEPLESEAYYDVGWKSLPENLRETLDIGDEQLWIPEAIVGGAAGAGYEDYMAPAAQSKADALSAIKDVWISADDAAADEVLGSAREQLMDRLGQAIEGTEYETTDEALAAMFGTGESGMFDDVSGYTYGSLGETLEAAEKRREAEQVALKRARIKQNLSGEAQVQQAQAGTAASGFAYSGAGQQAIEQAKYQSRADMGDLAETERQSRADLTDAETAYADDVSALVSQATGQEGQFQTFADEAATYKSKARDFIGESMQTLHDYQSELESILGFTPERVTSKRRLQKELGAGFGSGGLTGYSPVATPYSDIESSRRKLQAITGGGGTDV